MEETRKPREWGKDITDYRPILKKGVFISEDYKDAVNYNRGLHSGTHDSDKIIKRFEEKIGHRSSKNTD